MTARKEKAMSITLPSHPSVSRTASLAALKRAVLAAGVVVAVGAAGTVAWRTASSQASPALALLRPAAAAAPAAMEISAVRATVESDFLQIAGAATNRSGRPQKNLEVVTEFLDGEGRLLSVESALAEATVLAPGEETPFLVRAPRPEGAAAYRVRFRRLAGGMLPTSVR
jgi:hypothetical protein